jgi:lysophospholipase L1-like esterase
VNPTFENGTTGWQVSGAVHVLKTAANSEQLTIGPGPGSVSQRIVANAENHMMVSAILHSTPAGFGTLTVRFFDKDGRELMSLLSPSDIKAGKKPGTLEDYFRPHPLTASIEIIVSKGDSPGLLAVEQAELDVFHDNDATLRSTQNLSDLMRPFWNGPIVSGEAVLLTSSHDEPATGTLMFQPSRILSVTSYDGTIQYQEGADYTIKGRTLIAGESSSMSRIYEKDLLQGSLAWNVIGGKQILVTYEHKDPWTGPVQPYLGAHLPNTIHRLRSRLPLRVVVYGDSISYGLGSSHMQKMPPWQSPWADLFAEKLKDVWQDPDISVFNASQSGADSRWAKDMAGRMVASLHPDLVVIAFGQNDFWSISADIFADSISAVIHTVKASNPEAEFVLLSTMRFDPAYTSDRVYWNRVTQYEQRLRAMTTQGVQLVDMTAISGAVFAAKAPRDCLNDPLHPNDYLSRWYAQSLIAALAPDQDEQAVALSDHPFREKKGVGDDDPTDPQAIDETGANWYYNWMPNPSRGVIHAEFVPMVWGAQNLSTNVQAASRSGAKSLLTFNEPDSQTEANLTVEQAIDLWPKLESTGLRLGSPATTTESPWLDRFMVEAKSRHLRVDFICLHWYGDITAPDPVGALQKYLQGYWDRYHLPIWLTEFSGADFSFHLRKTTVTDNAQFVSLAGAMMEKLPFVERHAWFGTAWTPGSKDYPSSGLYDNATHQLTPVGIAFKAIPEE